VLTRRSGKGIEIENGIAKLQVKVHDENAYAGAPRDRTLTHHCWNQSQF